MIDLDFVNSPDHQRLRWMVRRECDPRVLEWERRFIGDAGDVGIPLVATVLTDKIVRVEHAQYGQLVTLDDAELIAGFGHQAAYRAMLNVVWSGRASGEPDLWDVYLGEYMPPFHLEF